MSELAVNANNKIIDREMLVEIFEAMSQEIEKYRQIAEQEKAQNEPLQREYQKWTLRYFNSSIRLTVDFQDKRSVTYDNCQDLIRVLKSQPFSIKSINAYCSMSYERPGANNSFGDSMHNSISIYITEKKFELSSNLASGDQYMQSLYDLIAQKIAAAPPKYDRIIKAKELINFKIGFAMGLIPAAIAVAATTFIPQLKDFYRNYYIAFPGLALILAVALGILLGNVKTGASYAKLIPKKYGGYDANTRSSYYKDDIQTLTETSDVLIGEKANNMIERQKIAANEKRFTKLIPIFLGVVAVICIVMFFLTR